MSPTRRDPDDTRSTPPANARGYEEFEGRIGRSSSESTPWWPTEAVAPTGAPNIVVILIDDLGYSDIGPFGSEIETPAIDSLADTGYRLTNYHTPPVCSPARAALLTGLNPHRAGFGSVPSSDPGFPGLRMQLADDVLSLPEILRANGYATFAIGKWHLVRDVDLGPGRKRDSWPLQRGFDSYYGSLEGLNSFYHPNQLIADNSVVDVDEYPEDYYVTDDLTDRSIAQIKALRAQQADKPFFLYFAHIAMHGPHQAKPADLRKYSGRYAEGWDVIRRRRFARQIEDGLFDDGTPMAERNVEPGHDVPPWDELSPDEQQRYARYQETYAAMVDSVDQSVARVVDTLRQLGELENTIIVVTSDNGGTAEGGPTGTRSYFSQFVGGPVPSDWVRDVPHDENLIGSSVLGTHYPRGWGQASNTPFRLYKGQAFAGGVRVPFVLSWPAGLPRRDQDDGVRRQFSYVTDLTPTLVQLAGLTVPADRHGRPARRPDGVAITPVFHDATAPSSHTEQYTEFGGHRGFYRDGWKLLHLHSDPARIDDPCWQLYDVRTDPAETHDLVTERPDKVAELAHAWEEAAWHNTVFPLMRPEAYAIRRSDDTRYDGPVRILAGTPPLERYRSAQLIQYRDFGIEVELADFDPATDEGVLVAHGDPFGGYLLAVEHGSLHFVFNGYGRISRASGPLPRGVTEIALSAVATPDVRWSFTGTARAADGAVVEVLSLSETFQLIGSSPWTGISVGLDARGPVDLELRRRRGPFRYSGTLVAVSYRPGEVKVPRTLREHVAERAEAAAD